MGEHGMIVPGACFNLFPSAGGGVSHPVFGNTDWQPSAYQPLVWSGTSWDYDGNYGGCDACVRGIIPLGTWGAGFTANSVEITFTSDEAWSVFGDLLITITGSTGDWLSIWETMPEGIKPAGTYTLSYAVTPSGDLTKFAMWLGGGDGPASDRSFQITNIAFT